MLFLKSILLGLSVAAPVGPIGLLCIQRSLVNGKRAGFFTGLGAATADTMYAACAAFGFQIVSQFLVKQHTWFQLLGGLFLLYIAMRILRAEPAKAGLKSTERRLTGMYFSTLLLTLTNPLTILAFVAMFAGLGFASEPQTILSTMLIIFGVFLGSSLWWFILSYFVSQLKHRMTDQLLRFINLVAGVILIGLALFSFIHLFIK